MHGQADAQAGALLSSCELEEAGHDTISMNWQKDKFMSMFQVHFINLLLIEK